jgi:hypothetical protein
MARAASHGWHPPGGRKGPSSWKQWRVPAPRCTTFTAFTRKIRTGDHRPAHRPPGPRPERPGSRGARRAVPGLALPHRVHRFPVHPDPGRSPAPRPRPGRAGARGLDRRPLAHLPPGSFPASAAWLALAAISHNLLRAAGSLASLAYGKARGATIRRDLIDVAARTARHGRGHITVHLPEGWHREHEWINLLTAACGPPTAAA